MFTRWMCERGNAIVMYVWVYVYVCHKMSQTRCGHTVGPMQGFRIWLVYKVSSFSLNFDKV